MTTLKKHAYMTSLLCLCLAALFVLSACGASSTAQEPSVESPIADVEDSPEPVEDSPEPVEDSPEPTLPPPPEIDINSWEYILANSYNSIAEFQPTVVSFAGQGIDARALGASQDFLYAARGAGFTVYVGVANRSWDSLLAKYDRSVRTLGSAEAAAAVCLGPGVNDHQTGLAIDFTDDPMFVATEDPIYNEDFDETELYDWLCEHCAEYGFILRYPEGKEEYYGTACCPGHFRYVGVEAAEYITENNLCLEEFIMLYDESLVYLPGRS